MRKNDHCFQIRGNLKKQIRNVFAFIICIYLGIVIIFFGVCSRSYINSYYKSANEELLASTISNLEAFSQNISAMSKMIMFSEEVVAFLRDEPEYNYANRVKALKKIYNIMDYYEQISSVYVFKLTGEYVNVSISHTTTKVNREVFANEEWLSDILQKEGYYLIQLDGNGLFLTQEGQHMMTFVRLINDLESQSPIGVIAVNCSTDMLQNTLLSALGQHNNFLIVGESGDRLAGEQIDIDRTILQECMEKNERGAILTRVSEGRVITSCYLKNAPLIFVKISELSYWKYPKGNMLLLLLIYIALSIVIMICLNVFVSIKIVSPIEKLTTSMKKTKEGYLYRVSLNSDIDEINILKESYNDMLVEINRLINELVKKERVAQQAKFEVVIEQINPHFLYNTLETIGYMALDSTGEEVYDAIVSLGEFYRSFLNKGDEMIAVSMEVDMVRNYLKLQKLRYNDLFEDEYEVEEAVMDYKIPKLLLQPLVENSLYHGVRMKGEKGIIKISAYRKEEYLILSVYDTGVGMSQEKINAVLLEEKEGFGLKRTLQRISYIYKEDMPYKIESREGHYCKIDLLIPLTGVER